MYFRYFYRADRERLIEIEIEALFKFHKLGIFCRHMLIFFLIGVRPLGYYLFVNTGIYLYAEVLQAGA